MKHTEITSSIQLAARLVDILYRETLINADSGQALFDILADSLEKRPDIVAAVNEDLLRYQAKQINQAPQSLTLEEQANLQWWHSLDYMPTSHQEGDHNTKDSAPFYIVTGGSNED